jgi:hypothetical protein
LKTGPHAPSLPCVPPKARLRDDGAQRAALLAPRRRARAAFDVVTTVRTRCSAAGLFASPKHDNE